MNNRLTFFDAYYNPTNRKMYFFARECNGLFCIDIGKNKGEYLLSIKEYEVHEKQLFGTVVENNNMLYFAPISANDILIYDISNNAYRLIPVERRKYYGESFKFFGVYSYEESIYFFPAHYPAIVKYVSNENDLKYYDDWIPEIRGDIGQENYFRQSLCFERGRLIVPLCGLDSVLEFNISTGKGEIKKIDTKRKKNKGFSGICSDGKIRWLLSLYSGEMYKLDNENRIIEVIDIGNLNEKEKYSYVGCKNIDGNVYVLPSLRNDLCVFKEKTNELLRIKPEEYNIDNNRTHGSQSTIFSIVDAKRDGLLACTREGEYYSINTDNNQIKMERYMIDYKDALVSWYTENDKIGINMGFSLEEDDLDLQIFLGRISKTK